MPVLARSRWHSRGTLSVRSPSKRGWRSMPFCVHSLKAISATSWGQTQWSCDPYGGSPASKGNALCSSVSRTRAQVAQHLVHIASTDFPDIDETLPVIAVVADKQRTKAYARPRWISEPLDN